MAKVVNLNKFKNQRAKLEREQRTETNKRLHGRTKAERLKQGDPRPSIEERYSTRQEYLEKVKAAAESLARVMLSGDPSDVRSLTLLAEIALARRAAGDARTYLGRALSVDPYDPEARALLARHDGHAAALSPGRVRTVR